MDKTRTKDSAPDECEIPDRPDRPELPGDGAQRVGGLEINLGDFTRTLVLMKSLRLMLNHQIAVPVDDLASGVGEAGRKFKLGDIEQAHQDVARLYATFGQKTNQWESQARRLEQQMKMQAAKDPKAISINKMNEMKSEQIAVRTRIRTAEVQFRRLHQGLDALYTARQSKPESIANQPSSEVSSDFLASFRAAAAPDRQEIVQRCCEVEVLTVRLSKNPQAGYDVVFDPRPPVDRIYFLTKTAQVVRLQQLRKIVVMHDLETDQRTEMKLGDFVKHVQSGVWLLSFPDGGAASQ